MQSMSAVSQLNNLSTRQLTRTVTVAYSLQSSVLMYMTVVYKQTFQKVTTDLLPSKRQLHPVCLVELYRMATCSCTFPLLCCNCIGLEPVHLLHLCNVQQIYVNITTYYQF